MANLSDLIYRWHLGWRASRDIPAAEKTADALWIHCAQPSREFEAIALHADEDPESVRRLADQVLGAKERTWLTVATERPAAVAEVFEAAGLPVLLRSEALMRTDLTRQPVRALDPAYTCVVEVEGACVTVSIRDGAGELAARGQIGLVGEDAVPDRIETMPDFRRRGLGGVVMGVLAGEAVSRGARTGLLIASEDGQRLYSTLGWERVATVVVGQAPAS